MKVTYVYHSCFVIECDDYSIIIDFYKDIKWGKNKLLFVRDYLLNTKNDLYVLCTHSHYDHYNPEILLWREQKKNIKYIFSKEILDTEKLNGFDACFLDKLDCFVDENIKVQAFGSTDIGCSFLIDMEGKKIFHAGDLNNWHWKEEVPKEEALLYENNFLVELDILKKYVTDLYLAMFPVDPRLGKEYMLGAEQFVVRFKPKYFLPMHFGENNFDKANAFADYAQQHGVDFLRLRHNGQSYEL